MQRAVNPPSLLEIHGGSNPSLRIKSNVVRRAGSSDGGTPASKSGSGRFDPCPACLTDRVTEWPGAGLQSPTYRFDSCRGLCGRSSTGQSAGMWPRWL
jgi:hypothetical protein